MGTSLENNVCIVTGASSGIGQAAALALAEKGTLLGLIARSPERLQEVARQATDRGARGVLALQCDVRQEDDVQRSVGRVLEQWGRVDVLLNVAGLGLRGPVDGFSLDDWRTVLDTNLTGTFLMCRAVLPSMRQRRTGQILNVSSGAGKNGIAEMAAYCASKFGVIGFTESLGLEVRNDNIRVAVVCPGSTETAFGRTANRGTDKKNAYAMTPGEVAGVLMAVLRQPPQAWMSEVVLRPLNLKLER